MGAARTLALFAAAMLTVFVGGLLIGGAIGPEPSDPPTAGPPPGEHP